MREIVLSNEPVFKQNKTICFNREWEYKTGGRKF